MKESIKKRFSFINKILNVIKENNVTTYASSWSFFFLVAVVPLFFLLITALKIFNVDVSFILSGLPNEFSEVLSIIGDLASKGLKGATFFFSITILYSSSNLFSHVLKDGELIYLKKRKKKGLVRKVISFLTLSIVFLIFMVIALISLLSNRITRLIPSGKYFSVLSKIIFNSLVILVLYGIIILLNYFVSPKKLAFIEVLTGSLVSLAILVLGTCAFMLYVTFISGYTNLYGNLSIVIIFLLWTYLITFGLVFGISVTKTLNDKKN